MPARTTKHSMRIIMTGSTCTSAAAPLACRLQPEMSTEVKGSLVARALASPRATPSPESTLDDRRAHLILTIDTHAIVLEFHEAVFCSPDYHLPAYLTRLILLNKAYRQCQEPRLVATVYMMMPPSP